MTDPGEEPGVDAARWAPLAHRTVTDALEDMLEHYSANIGRDHKLLIQVALARKLARRVDSEMDGTKLAALVIRLRTVVDALGVAAPDADAVDEVAQRRREREQSANARFAE